MPDRRVEIIIVGSHAPGLFLRVDRVPRAGETVVGWDYQEPMDGGKGSNQAIAAARLGAGTSFVGCVGKDRLGRTGARWMRDNGVDVRFLLRSAGVASGVGFIMLDRDGKPAMVTSMGANAELTKEHAERAIRRLGTARVLLTQFEILPAVALRAAEVARELGMVTVVNPAPAPAEEVPRGMFGGVDYLVPNEVEAMSLLGLPEGGQLPPNGMARELLGKMGVRCVMVTAGERGVGVADGSGDCMIAAPKVNVVDTSGAGDVFCAALSVGIAKGQDHRAAAAWACGAAALSVTRAGTIPSFPSLAEVVEFGRPS
jgi:ribokinase